MNSKSSIIGNNYITSQFKRGRDSRIHSQIDETQEVGEICKQYQKQVESQPISYW